MIFLGYEVHKAEKPEKPKKPPKKRRRLEFFQRVIIVLITLSTLTTAASYVLAVFDKQTVENLSIEVFKTLWGGTEIGVGAYAVLHSVRAVTGAKYGLVKDVKPDIDDDSGEADLPQEEIT